jgi:restriction system protein
MKPVLELAETEQKYSVAVQKIGDLFNLTEEDRAETTDKGTNLLENRVAWALTYLVKAGLVERPRRGYFVKTDLGKQTLSSKPEKIDNKFLAQFEGFKNFRSSPANGRPSEDMTSVVSNEDAHQRKGLILPLVR